MKIKIKCGDSYIKYSTGHREEYQLENGADVEGVYTVIDELYVPEKDKNKRIEYRLLNEAMKRIIEEGDLTIKYFMKKEKDIEKLDYIYAILTDFGFRVISSTSEGVMFGFLTKEELEQ